MPSSRFSGLMSRWMTCFAWQYSSARARDAMYLRPKEASQDVPCIALHWISDFGLPLHHGSWLAQGSMWGLIAAKAAA